MNWFKRLFSRNPDARPQTPNETLTGDLDMRFMSVDNPFDYRPNGSIQAGDPAWNVFKEMMETGKPIIGNQRADGTWDVRSIDSEDSRGND